MAVPIIPKTMKAAVLKKVQTPFEVIEVPVPTPGPNDILLKIVATSMCHSDLMLLREKLSLPIPEEGRIIGHEACGIVVGLGSEIQDRGFKIGDRCGAIPMDAPCLKCEMCVEYGKKHCENATIRGMTSSGLFSEYSLVNIESAVKLPDLTNEELVELSPLFCAGMRC
jgi:propanol-preferring alcohol dehydrogenase